MLKLSLGLVKVPRDNPQALIQPGLILYVSEEGQEQRLFSDRASDVALDAVRDYLGWRPRGVWLSYSQNTEGQSPPPEMGSRALWFMDFG